MNLSLPLLLWLAAQSVASAGTVSGADGAAFSCPVTGEDHGVRIRNILGSPGMAELRAHYKLGTASPDNAQLLTDEHDAETCAALWTAMRESGTDLSGEVEISFYRSGDTYFVPIKRPRLPTPGVVIQLDGSASRLEVYDPQFRLVVRFGM